MRSELVSKHRQGKSDLEETIQDGNCEVQSLLQQLEPGVHLDQPVDEESSHAICDFVALHVVWANSLLHLQKQQPC